MKDSSLFRGMRTSVAVVSLLAVLGGCNQGSDDICPDCGTEGPATELNDRLIVIASKKGTLLSAKTWHDGNTLGLFLTKDNLARPYENDAETYSNIKATMKAGVWALTPEVVTLTAEEAVIWAYSPYKRGVDPYAVPVETASRTQYMFGTHMDPQEHVRMGENLASLEMSHAMSLIDVIVRKNYNFKERAVLNAVSIEAASDSIKLPTEGTMDIMTGKITNTAYGSYGHDGLRQVLPDVFADSCTYRMTAIPRENAEGEVKLSITVNGNRLSVPLKDEHDWPQGVRSIYRVVFDGTALRLESVEIKEWKEEEIETELEGV